MSRTTVRKSLGAGLFAAMAVTAITSLGVGQASAVTKESKHNGMVRGTVWVANEGGDSLSAIDAAKNKVVTTVNGIPGPHNVQVSPDGRSVWAVSGHDSLAVIINAKSLALHGTVPTGRMPAHIVLTPNGKMGYTTNGADNTVTAFDASTMKPIATIPVGSGPHGLRPSPDGKWIYLANLGGTTLSVIDTATNAKVADIEVGVKPAQVAFSPDGRFVYASLNGENAVAKIDTTTRKLVGKVKVGVGPIQVFVSPDSKYLLVANQGTATSPGKTISIVGTSTFKVLRSIETGKGAHGIVIDPSSRHAYVTNIYGNDVAVVDLKEQKVVARVAVGIKPNGISFSPITVTQRPAIKIALPMDSSGSGSMQKMP